MEVSHGHCHCCRTISISNVIHNNKCQKCTGRPLNYFEKRKVLPIWYKDGLPQYHVPPELSDLTYAEKMLIQRISPFIPLIHIKNGTHGLSGHVCAFEQDIGEFITRLPRQRHDVTMLKVLKTVQAEIGDDKATRVHAFRVRRKQVLEALLFLKAYNDEYSDIVIDESALDWLGDAKEGSLDAMVIDEGGLDSIANEVMVVDNPFKEDLGPNPKQTIRDRDFHGDNINTIGFLSEGGNAALGVDDKKINDQLQKTIDSCKKRHEIEVNFPQVAETPVSEFSQTKIFVRAFPWLFPGGLGDIRDDGGHVGDWGRRLLMYEDGRFARDKFFGFFALNYIIRQRNSSSGKFFVDTFQSNSPDTLEELQSTIEAGDTKFVNSLTYYSKRVKGSSAYWFQKRSELYTWINYHVEQGNGAPMFFITLSCAEYAWPDIVRLIRERMELAGQDPSGCYIGSPKMSSIVNEYSIVIQEYFQRRVEIWLEGPGREIFGIKHYWVRFEFAPGRGQIHAHLLAIAQDQNIYELCNIVGREENGVASRAKILSEWAQDKFGLTAEVDEGFDEIQIEHTESPVSIRFCDLNRKDACIQEDGQRLLKQCQVHECSGFCMRAPRSGW